MKYLMIVLLIFPFGLNGITQKKDLYLLYSKKDQRIKKFFFTSDKFETFTYVLKYKGEQYETIAFYEVLPNNRDTLQIKKMSSIEYHDIDWLTIEYLNYFNHFRDKNAKVNEDGSLRAFNLNKMYKSIYIVLPDSCSKEAVITEVKYNPYFSID